MNVTGLTRMLVHSTLGLLRAAGGNLNTLAPFVALDGAVIGAPGRGWAQMTVSQFVQFAQKV